MKEPRVALRILAAVLTVLFLTALAGCRPDGIWSGDSSRLALVVRGQLLTYEVKTGAFRKFPQPGKQVFGQQWSPNGRQIAFYRAVVAPKNEEVSALDVAVLDVASGKTRVIAPKVSPPLEPKTEGGLNLNVTSRIDFLPHESTLCWKPDGRQIVFTNHDGKEPAPWNADLGGAAPRRLLPDGKVGHYPVWSPDGKWIAYHMSPPESRTDPNSEGPKDRPTTLEVVSVEGGESRTLWDITNKLRLAPMGPLPEWAPDSKSLAVIAAEEKQEGQPDPSERRCELWKTPLDGTPSRLAMVPGPFPFMDVRNGRIAYLFPDETDGPKQALPVQLLAPPYESSRTIATLTPTTLSQPKGKSMKADNLPIPSLSPDGKWVALPVVFENGPAYLLLVSTESGKPVRRVTIPVQAPASNVNPAPRRRKTNG